MVFDEGMNEIGELYETKELRETDINYDGIKEINVEFMNGVEGFGAQPMIVAGSPFEIAGRLDCAQGDNRFNVSSNCGLVSCSNYLNICGIEADEDEIVEFALENNLCSRSIFSGPESWGGTNDENLETILEHYGVESTVFYPNEAGGSIEGIANAIEDGHAVMIGVNAGYLWDNPNHVGNGRANHQITVTGTVRDASGELTALTVCDSGRHLDTDSCRVVSVSEMESFYTRIPGASAIISDKAVR